MAFALSLSFTDTSLVLLTVIIGLSLYSKYFSGYTPLVHPLLLRKQSDVSQTRKEGESAVYRSWATGHGTPVSKSTINSGMTGLNSCPSRLAAH